MPFVRFETVARAQHHGAVVAALQLDVAREEVHGPERRWRPGLDCIVHEGALPNFRLDVARI
jgi:hypothetical protein